MQENRFSRRKFLLGMGTAAIGISSIAGMAQRKDEDVVEVLLARNELLGIWYIDPLGILIQPGQTIRWKNLHWGRQ